MISLPNITDSMDRNLSKLQEIVEDRGAWRAIFHAFTKSWTQLSNSAAEQTTLGTATLNFVTSCCCCC